MRVLLVEDDDILGAAGRDFHVFNTVYRNAPHARFLPGFNSCGFGQAAPRDRPAFRQDPAPGVAAGAQQDLRAIAVSAPHQGCGLPAGGSARSTIENANV